MGAAKLKGIKDTDLYNLGVGESLHDQINLCHSVEECDPISSCSKLRLRFMEKLMPYSYI